VYKKVIGDPERRLRGQSMEGNVRSRASIAILVAAGLCAAPGIPQAQNKASAADKPFVAGGKVDIELSGGDYTIRPAADNHIRVTLGGSVGNTKVELTVKGTQANVVVTDTPRSNFQATIEVPATADIALRLAAGNLVVGGVTGNKDVRSTAGNVELAVDPTHYSSVEATVKAGDIDAGALGESKSGLFQRFTWSGHGKYTLRATLGAGNLSLRGK
jgi:hypothetical protein